MAVQPTHTNTTAEKLPPPPDNQGEDSRGIRKMDLQHKKSAGMYQDQNCLHRAHQVCQGN